MFLSLYNKTLLSSYIFYDEHLHGMAHLLALAGFLREWDGLGGGEFPAAGLSMFPAAWDRKEEGTALWGFVPHLFVSPLQRHTMREKSLTLCPLPIRERTLAGTHCWRKKALGLPSTHLPLHFTAAARKEEPALWPR